MDALILVQQGATAGSALVLAEATGLTGELSVSPSPWTGRPSGKKTDSRANAVIIIHLEDMTSQMKACIKPLLLIIIRKFLQHGYGKKKAGFYNTKAEMSTCHNSILLYTSKHTMINAIKKIVNTNISKKD